MEYSRPLEWVRDTVAVVRTPLRDSEISHAGETVWIERFDLWFRPFRREIPVRLYCFSEERAAKERRIAERFARRLESALTQLSEGLSKPRTQKRLDQVWQRIDRLKEKGHGIAQHYDIELDTDESEQRATAVRFTRRALPGSMMTHPGVYCLRGSEIDWDEATLWQTYFTLTDLEAVFRSLISELGLRPIHHHKPIRADGHLFITVIAYQLEQVLRTRLRQAGENASWTTLRRILEAQPRIIATFPACRRAHLHVRKEGGGNRLPMFRGSIPRKYVLK